MCALLFFGLFAAGYGHALWLDAASTYGWIGFGLAMVILLGMTATHLAYRYRVRIFPYYDQALPGAETYLSGHALARNCLHLDRLADERGLKGMSAFGFNDALLGEPIVWHDPGEGLATVSGLLAAVANRPEAVDDARAVTTELTKIQTALALARDKNVRFAFLLELGDSTSARVWEIRQGHVGG